MNVPGIKSNDAQELYRFSQNVKQGFVPGSDGAYNTIQTPIVVSTVIAFDTVFANRAVLNFVDFTAGEGGQIVVSWRGVLSNSGATPATQLRVGLEISMTVDRYSPHWIRFLWVFPKIEFQHRGNRHSRQKYILGIALGQLDTIWQH